MHVLVEVVKEIVLLVDPVLDLIPVTMKKLTIALELVDNA